MNTKPVGSYLKVIQVTPGSKKFWVEARLAVCADDFASRNDIDRIHMVWAGMLSEAGRKMNECLEVEKNESPTTIPTPP